MMMDMASADQIAERALWLARAAVDDLAELSNGEVTGLRDAQMQLATNRPTDEDASRRRETWERHAALQLLVGASCLEPDDGQ